jgi:hypothetical protein
MDTHITNAIAVQLRVNGVDVVRCEEVGMATASDPEHLEYATQLGRVVISHDQDFLRLHKEWQLQGKKHAGILYCLPSLQGKPGIGRIVKECLDLHMMILGGAGTIEDDVANRIYFVR